MLYFGALTPLYFYYCIELRKRNVGAPNNGPRHPSQQMAPNTAPPRAMAPRMIGNGSNIRSPAGAPLMQNGQQFATPNMRGTVFVNPFGIWDF